MEVFTSEYNDEWGGSFEKLEKWIEVNYQKLEENKN
jgi:hypothetical protein